MDIAIAILAGGKSKRMGCCKMNMKLEEETFLNRICKEIDQYKNEKIEKWISVSNDYHEDNQIPENFVLIRDRKSKIGPIGGIYTILNNCKSEYLYVIACDMPLFSKELINNVVQTAEKEKWKFDAWIYRTEDGKKHPLCGMYKKKICKENIEKQLKKGIYKMSALLDTMNVHYLDGNEEYKKYLINVNTQEEYIRLEKEISII